MKRIVSIALNIPFLTAPGIFAASLDEKASEILEYYCFDCHDTASQKGNLNQHISLVHLDRLFKCQICKADLWLYRNTYK